MLYVGQIKLFIITDLWKRVRGDYGDDGVERRWVGRGSGCVYICMYGGGEVLGGPQSLKGNDVGGGRICGQGWERGEGMH